MTSVAVGPVMQLMSQSTVEPLYCGHLGDLVRCPVQRGVQEHSIVDTLGT